MIVVCNLFGKLRLITITEINLVTLGGWGGALGTDAHDICNIRYISRVYKA